MFSRSILPFAFVLIVFAVYNYAEPNDEEIQVKLKIHDDDMDVQPVLVRFRGRRAGICQTHDDCSYNCFCGGRCIGRNCRCNRGDSRGCD
ncbi:hypothetical protein DdX_19140 [Ditylenchus destructor]|uniref:Uncharacterized protein n=1 Tax=Ditylenchus destructor TaxID=166010 RepID=A0AAD4QXN2_9BILA|nr:hypothetical protein DdX_19140 [Ditylenchus destructor]